MLTWHLCSADVFDGNQQNPTRIRRFIVFDHAPDVNTIKNTIGQSSRPNASVCVDRAEPTLPTAPGPPPTASEVSTLPGPPPVLSEVSTLQAPGPPHVSSEVSMPQAPGSPGPPPASSDISLAPGPPPASSEVSTLPAPPPDPDVSECSTLPSPPPDRSEVQTPVTLPAALPSTGMLHDQTILFASPVTAESESVVPTLTTVTWPGKGEKKKAAKMQPKGICTAK